MVARTEELAAGAAGAAGGAEELLARAREAFAARGLMGKVVAFVAGGRRFHARCDRECFTVYEVNQTPHLPPGLPGWMVCRLGVGQCFGLAPGESCPPPVGQGELARAGQWVELTLASLADATMVDTK